MIRNYSNEKMLKWTGRSSSLSFKTRLHYGCAFMPPLCGQTESASNPFMRVLSSEMYEFSLGTCCFPNGSYVGQMNALNSNAPNMLTPNNIGRSTQSSLSQDSGRNSYQHIGLTQEDALSSDTPKSPNMLTQTSNISRLTQASLSQDSGRNSYQHIRLTQESIDVSVATPTSDHTTPSNSSSKSPLPPLDFKVVSQKCMYLFEIQNHKHFRKRFGWIAENDPEYCAYVCSSVPRARNARITSFRDYLVKERGYTIVSSEEFKKKQAAGQLQMPIGVVAATKAKDTAKFNEVIEAFIDHLIAKHVARF